MENLEKEKLQEEKQQNEAELTPEEIWSVLQFAQNFMNVGNIGSLIPQIGANRLGELSSGNLGNLDSLMRDQGQATPTTLAQYSQALEMDNQIYRKLIAYSSNMLAFDFTYTAKAYDGKTDYKSFAYKKDLATVEDFFMRFDHKREFLLMTRQLLRNEIYFCIPRFEGEKIFLQELPMEFCRITGRGAYGFRFAFNFSYFDDKRDILERYPQFFIDVYDDLGNILGKKGRKQKKELVYEKWIDIPSNIGFVFKFGEDTLNYNPPFSGIFKDLINQHLMRNLQKSADMAAAQKIVLGEIGRVRDTQSKTGNNFDVDAATLGRFMGFMKNALGDSVKLAALPLEDTKAISFDTEKGLYRDYLKTTWSASGINSNLTFADSENRPNSLETQLSLNVDEQAMTQSVYSQVEAFLELFVNLATKKYHFKFVFEGTEFSTDKNKRQSAVSSLLNYGIFLPQKIAASMGMSPFDFERQIEEGFASGIADKLTFLLNKTEATSVEEDKGGRPQKSEEDLSDSGMDTRDSGVNLGRGGSV